MGYYTRFEGEIEIFPALPMEAVNLWNTGVPANEPGDTRWLAFQLVQGPALPDGSGFLYTILRSPEGSGKFYRRNKIMESLIDFIYRLQDPVTYSGTITAEGEDLQPGEHQQYVGEGETIVTLEGRMVYE